MTTDDGLSLAFGVILFAALVVLAALVLTGCGVQGLDAPALTR